MKPGIYHDLFIQDYHASPGVSSSVLAEMHRSPAHAKALHDKPPTPAMKLGTHWHDVIALGADEWLRSVYVLPEDHDGRTKEGKSRLAEVAERGIEAVKHGDAARVVAMRRALDDLEIDGVQIADLLASGRQEVSRYWIDEPTGELVKCRPDLEVERAKIVLDWKSCDDARPEAFERSALRYRYAERAALYLDGCQLTGLDADLFVWVAVESAAPHAAMTYWAAREDAILRKGRCAYRKHLDKWHECVTSGKWPGYEVICQPLNEPKWAQEEE